jgi:DNA-directed RNA polymerase subunit RPC12/RpoP
MSNFESQFVSLRCPHCSGKVEITPGQIDESFVESGDGYIYIGVVGGEQIKCQHCKTEFVRKQHVDVAIDGKGTINTGGGAFINGSINLAGGDFVGRDRIQVNSAFNQSGQTVHGEQLNINAGPRGVSIRGNVHGSSIITGDDITIIRRRS